MLLIANPHARRVRRHPRLLTDLQHVGGAGLRLERPDSVQGLQQLAEHLASSGWDAPVAILGGDGTLSVTLDALATAWQGEPLPPIVPLQGGTMNTIARSMTHPTAPGRQLAATLAGMSGERPLQEARRSLLRIEGHRHGFLFGMGLIAQFLVLHYRADDPTPLTAAATLADVAVSALFGRTRHPEMFQGLQATVHVDGRLVHEGPTLAVGAGTCDDAGLRFRPFSLALRHPGHMHAYVSTAHLPRMVRDLLRFRRAMRAVGPGSVELAATRLQVQLAEPAPFQLDGDLFGPTRRVAVQTGPTVRFLLPSLRRGIG